MGEGNEGEEQDQSEREKEKPLELVGGWVGLLFYLNFWWFLQACHWVRIWGKTLGPGDISPKPGLRGRKTGGFREGETGCIAP